MTVRSKKRAKADATTAARKLITTAVETAPSDLDLAKKQAALARRVMLRYNVRFDYSLKRFTCHGCKKLLVPGVNARVRLSGGKQKVLRVTCLGCGRVNRKILRHP